MPVTLAGHHVSRRARWSGTSADRRLATDDSGPSGAKETRNTTPRSDSLPATGPHGNRLRPPARPRISLVVRAVTGALIVTAATAAWYSPPALGQAPTDLEGSVLVYRTQVEGERAEVEASVRVATGEQAPLPRAISLRQDGEVVPAEVTRLPEDRLEVAVVVTTGPGSPDPQVAEDALTRLAETLPDGASAALVESGERPGLRTPMTTDVTEIIGTVGQPPVAPAGGPIDPLTLAVDQFSPGPDVRRAIVTIGATYPGRAENAQELTRRVEALSASSYSVLLDTSFLGTARPTYPLPRLGGRAIQTSDAGAADAVGSITDELTTRYRLTFPAPSEDDTEFELRVATLAGRLSVDFTLSPQPDLHQPPRNWRRPGLAITGVAGLVAVTASILYLLPRLRLRLRLGSSVETPVPVHPSAGTAAAGSTPPWSSADRRDVVGLGGDRVEGRKAVNELLDNPQRRVYRVTLAAGQTAPEIRARATAAGVPVVDLPEDPMATSGSMVGDGVLALTDPLPSGDLDVLSSSAAGPLTVVLLVDPLDPVSLGRLLRDVSGAGATAVAMPKSRPNPITPTVTALAEGAVEHLRFVLVPNPATALAVMRNWDYLVLGVELTEPSTLRERSFHVDLSASPIAIVVGAGLQLDLGTRAWCDALIGMRLSATDIADPPTIARLACEDLAQLRTLPADPPRHG